MWTLYTAIVAWLASFFASKSAALLIRLSVLAVFIVVLLAFMAIFVSASIYLIDGIAVSVPTEVTRVWGWFMPPNTAACLVAIVSARFIRFALDFKMKVAMLKARMIRD